MASRSTLYIISGIAFLVLALTLPNIITYIDDHVLSSGPDQQRKPNIIFVMLDDWGFNDASWNNPQVLTPNIEQLARSGVILNRNYVHNMCTPSRVELLTGKYVHRLGRQVGVILPNSPGFLPAEEKLLSQHLKEAGYDTHLVGKWHLGHCNPKYLPLNRGFDTFYGTWNGYTDSYTKCSQSGHLNDSALDWHDQDQVDSSTKGVHVTDLIKQRASKIIHGSKSGKPFFMLLSFTAPHTPLQVPDKYLKRYDHIEDPWRKKFLAMVSHVDDALGEVVGVLKETGLMENTIIVLTGDNGGEKGPGNNYPLRGAKSSTFEGGTRVPGFISGPKSIIKKFGYINQEKFHITDWLPTLLSMAKKSTISKDENLDGVDQTDMLLDGGKSKRREMVYRIHTSDPDLFSATISYDRYKLIWGFPGGSDGWEQDKGVGMRIDEDTIVQMPRKEKVANGNPPLCDGTYEQPYDRWLLLKGIAYGRHLSKQVLLFDIEADPEERENLAEMMPDKVRELKDRLQKHFQHEVKPQDFMPVPTDTIQQDQAWITGWC